MINSEQTEEANTSADDRVARIVAAGPGGSARRRGHRHDAGRGDVCSPSTCSCHFPCRAGLAAVPTFTLTITARRRKSPRADQEALGDDLGHHHRRRPRAAGGVRFGIHRATMPQARCQGHRIPLRLHLSGEFVESNLGSVLESNGSVTVRAIGQQYSFTQLAFWCRRKRRSRSRATSADVVHGILVQGTNINTMLVPGYVSEQFMRFEKTGEHLMPCQEFCSFGHEGIVEQGQGDRQGGVQIQGQERREDELCW